MDALHNPAKNVQRYRRPEIAVNPKNTVGRKPIRRFLAAMSPSCSVECAANLQTIRAKSESGAWMHLAQLFWHPWRYVLLTHTGLALANSHPSIRGVRIDRTPFSEPARIRQLGSKIGPKAESWHLLNKRNG